MTPDNERRLHHPQLSRTLSGLLDAFPADDTAPQQTRRLVIAMLEDAIRENASDIHLDPVVAGYQVRFRIDGRMVDTALLDAERGRYVLRCLKSNCDLDPAFRMLPQDGRADFAVGNTIVAVRVGTSPGVLGEKCAVRIIPTELACLRLDELGLSPVGHRRLRRALDDARGMILVSGPTGAGKTTTTYALLHELRHTNRSIVTIEDPVEYVIDGITQIQVNEAQGLTFSVGVKGLLRLDPDIVFMSEIRDRDSARASLDAAASGHVFLSTLHARDAAGTITALRNYGLADHDIAATVDLVVAQRLVRRLCPACRRQESPTPDEMDLLQICGKPIPPSTWHAVGCPECGQSGYRGRIGVFEVHRLHEEDADLILNHADEHVLRRHMRKSGTLSLHEDGFMKAADGLTCLGEIRSVGGLEFYASLTARGKRTRQPQLVRTASSGGSVE
jgi:general secretion pathway protein E